MAFQTRLRPLDSLAGVADAASVCAVKTLKRITIEKTENNCRLISTNPFKIDFFSTTSGRVKV